LQELPNIAPLRRRDLFRRAGGDDLAVVAFGSEVDDPIGGAGHSAAIGFSLKTRPYLAASAVSPRFNASRTVSSLRTSPGDKYGDHAVSSSMSSIGTSAAYFPSWMSLMLFRVMALFAV